MTTFPTAAAEAPGMDNYDWNFFRYDSLFRHRLSQFELNQIQVEVTWRPPQRHLHYNELYRGIYEYLRAPPHNDRREAALRYLNDIRANNVFPYNASTCYMQNDRIQWIQEWIKALPDDSGECSDADTVIFAD